MMLLVIVERYFDLRQLIFPTTQSINVSMNQTNASFSRGVDALRIALSSSTVKNSNLELLVPNSADTIFVLSNQVRYPVDEVRFNVSYDSLWLGKRVTNNLTKNYVASSLCTCTSFGID